MSDHSVDQQISELHSKIFYFFFAFFFPFPLYFLKNNGVSVSLGSIPCYSIIDVTSTLRHQLISRYVVAPNLYSSPELATVEGTIYNYIDRPFYHSAS